MEVQSILKSDLNYFLGPFYAEPLHKLNMLPECSIHHSSFWTPMMVVFVLFFVLLLFVSRHLGILGWSIGLRNNVLDRNVRLLTFWNSSNPKHLNFKRLNFRTFQHVLFRTFQLLMNFRKTNF